MLYYCIKISEISPSWLFTRKSHDKRIYEPNKYHIWNTESIWLAFRTHLDQFGTYFDHFFGTNSKHFFVSMIIKSFLLEVSKRTIWPKLIKKMFKTPKHLRRSMLEMKFTGEECDRCLTHVMRCIRFAFKSIKKGSSSK